MGIAFYNVWESLYAITENCANLTIEHIKKTNAKMSKSEMYAEIVDTLVGEELLLPIIKNIATIGNDIEQSYDQNKQWAKEDKEKYAQYVTEVENTISAIYDVYYIPNSKVNIEDFEELIRINERLEQLN